MKRLNHLMECVVLFCVTFLSYLDRHGHGSPTGVRGCSVRKKNSTFLCKSTLQCTISVFKNYLMMLIVFYRVRDLSSDSFPCFCLIFADELSGIAQFLSLSLQRSYVHIGGGEKPIYSLFG